MESKSQGHVYTTTGGSMSNVDDPKACVMGQGQRWEILELSSVLGRSSTFKLH